MSDATQEATQEYEVNLEADVTRDMSFEESAVKVKKAPKEPKAPREPKAPVDMQNGVSRPSNGSLCAVIWDKATELSNAKGEPVTKSELEKGLDSSVNASTISTQLGRWRKYHGLVTPRAKVEAAE